MRKENNQINKDIPPPTNPSNHYLGKKHNNNMKLFPNIFLKCENKILQNNDTQNGEVVQNDIFL